MRKSILFIAAIVFIHNCAHAQIKKGSVFLGGSFGITTQKIEIANSTNIQKNQAFNINPSAGIAFRQNTILGLGLLYTRSLNKVEPTLKQETKSYGISAFIRKYKMLGNNFYIFGDGSISYNKGETEIKTNPNGSQQQNTKTAGLAFYPGIAFAVNRRFHLEAGLSNLVYFNYSVNKGSDPSSPGNIFTSKTFSAGTSLSGSIPLTIGFRILLAKS
jgi:hypothetical protein